MKASHIILAVRKVNEHQALSLCSQHVINGNISCCKDRCNEHRMQKANRLKLFGPGNCTDTLIIKGLHTCTAASFTTASLYGNFRSLVSSWPLAYCGDRNRDALPCTHFAHLVKLEPSSCFNTFMFLPQTGWGYVSCTIVIQFTFTA